MPTLSLEEQEVHFSCSADEPDVWYCYSDYPKWQRKLEAMGAVFVKASGAGKHYTLRGNQLSLRKGVKREMSEAQKANIEKLAAYRRKTNS